ncbi:MAG: YerC/YecD family TrpR-related protein [bacterium]
MQNIDIDLLAEAFIKLRTKEEITTFLKDLLSNSEQETLLLRLQVAKLLDQGLRYLEVQRQTGASSATVAKVSEYLKYGFNGYKTALGRMKK